MLTARAPSESHPTEWEHRPATVGHVCPASGQRDSGLPATGSMAQLPRHHVRVSHRLGARPSCHVIIPNGPALLLGSSAIQYGPAATSARPSSPVVTSESPNAGEHGPAATSPYLMGPRCPTGRSPFSINPVPKALGHSIITQGPFTAQQPRYLAQDSQRRGARASCHVILPNGPALPSGSTAIQYLPSAQGTEHQCRMTQLTPFTRHYPGAHSRGTTDCR